MMALCNRCHVGLNVTVSLVTWARCSRNVLHVGYINPIVVVESWLLLVHLWFGLNVGLADYKDRPPTTVQGLCRDLSHEAEFDPAGSGACQDLPLGVPLMNLIGLCSDVVWIPPPGMLVLGLLGMVLVAGDQIWATCLELQSDSQFVAASDVSITGVYGRDQDVHQDQLLPWMVWLSGLSASLWTKRSSVRFLVRAHPRVAGQVPGWGHVRGNRSMFLSVFLLPFPSL